MGALKKIVTVLLVVLISLIGLVSLFFIVKTLCADIGNKSEREQFEIKFQHSQDSIQNEFNLLKQVRDFLLLKYDSL